MRFQQFPGKYSKSNRQDISGIGPEVNIFSTYCSTGEFLLHFLKVIITANPFLAFFNDC